MSTANRVIKNTGYLYAKMGITMFISLYTTRLILNSLGATDFGIFNIVGGAIAMLGFLNAAMASATQRFMSFAEGEGNRDKQKSIFNVSVVLHFLIALAIGIVLLIAGYFFFNGILNIPEDRIFAAKVVYGSLIVSTMFTVMTVPYDAVLNAHENMLYYSIVGIIESVLKLIVAFVVVYTLSDKLIIYGILMACIPLITMSIMRVYCHKHYEECSFKPQIYWHKGLMREMTSFAGWSFMGSMTSIITNYGMGIILNHFFGVILNTAQGIANQLNGQLMVFSNNMMKALSPVITKSEGKKNRIITIKSSLLGCKFSFIILSILAIPVLIETPFLIKLWLNEIPDWVIIFTRLQLIKTMIGQLTIAFGTALSAEGHIAKLSVFASAINLLSLPLIYLAFYFNSSPIYMYIINIIVLEIGLAIIKLYFMRRNCGMPYSLFFTRIFFPILLTSLVSILIGKCLTLYFQDGFLRLCVVVLFCDFSQLFLFWKFGLMKEEKYLLKSAVYTLINRFYK